MSEQEQAEALAVWLSEPVGTPPPAGLDPEVLEGVYALQPERAPAPVLTVEDILGGPIQGVEVAPMPPDVPLLPQGPNMVSEAPRRLPSANRLAGLGVLLATAAALVLVLLPQGVPSESEQTMLAEPEVFEDAVAAAPPPPPAPVTARAPAAPPMEEAPAVEAQKTRDDDAVADALGEAKTEFAEERRADAFDEPMGAEMDEADEFEDAVADLDLEAEEMEPGMAFGSDGAIPEAEGSVAGASGGVVGGMIADELFQAKSGSKRAPSSRSAAAPAAPAADMPVSSEPAPQADPVQRPSALSGIGPDSSWKDSLDENSLSLVQDALAIAKTEAQRGRPSRAAQVLGPWIAPPVASGHHCAAQAAQYYMQAGLAQQAAQTALLGTKLGVDGGASTVWLWAVYGDALAAQGLPDEANAAWSTAVQMMGSGG